MRLISLIFLILLFSKIETEAENISKNEYKQRYDDDHYSKKIKRSINKLGFSKNKLIDKEEYKNVYLDAFYMNLLEFKFQLYKKDNEGNNMKNLLTHAFYDLVKKEKDDMDVNDAMNLYEPNKILNSVENVLTKLGYPDLVEKVTNEVLEEENKDKDSKEQNKNEKTEKNKERNSDL